MMMVLCYDLGKIFKVSYLSENVPLHKINFPGCQFYFEEEKLLGFFVWKPRKDTTKCVFFVFGFVTFSLNTTPLFRIATK